MFFPSLFLSGFGLVTDNVILHAYNHWVKLESLPSFLMVCLCSWYIYQTSIVFYTFFPPTRTHRSDSFPKILEACCFYRLFTISFQTPVTKIRPFYYIILTLSNSDTCILKTIVHWPNEGLQNMCLYEKNWKCILFLLIGPGEEPSQTIWKSKGVLHYL